MSKTKLNVLFKKMQKDDKKEVLEFHVVGSTLPHTAELNEMAGNMVILDVTDSEAGPFPAEFAKFQRDSKKTVLQFKVKGDSEEKSTKLYNYAGSNVELLMQPSQMSIDDYYNEADREGIEYKVNSDGTAEVVPDQISMDDVDGKEDEGDFDGSLIGEDEENESLSDDDLLN